MDYEKLYKMALERANIIYTGKYKPEIAAWTKKTLEAIFPELKELKNEKIRKEIIDYIKIGTYKKDWIDWLENQDEKQFVYIGTRCEEHSDYVEKAFLDKEKAEAYCKQFNEDEDSYRRHITKVKTE